MDWKLELIAVPVTDLGSPPAASTSRRSIFPPSVITEPDKPSSESERIASDSS